MVPRIFSCFVLSGLSEEWRDQILFIVFKLEKNHFSQETFLNIILPALSQMVKAELLFLSELWLEEQLENHNAFKWHKRDAVEE